MQVTNIRTQNGLVIFQNHYLQTLHIFFCLKQTQRFQAAQKWKGHTGGTVTTPYCLD